MAIVRPQRAAIETVLSQSNQAVLKEDLTVITNVQDGNECFPVIAVGISCGDSTYHRFKDVPTVIYHRGNPGGAVGNGPEAAVIRQGSACVLDEPVPDGAANEHSVVLLVPVSGQNGSVVFKTSGRPVIYRAIV